MVLVVRRVLGVVRPMPGRTARLELDRMRHGTVAEPMSQTLGLQHRNPRIGIREHRKREQRRAPGSVG